MQNWEYLFVTGEKDWNIFRPKYVNDQEVPNWKKGKALSEYANELGKQGWELIGTPYTMNSRANFLEARLIFKRSIG